MTWTVRAFGTWDAPITDDAEWIDVPVGQLCMHCQESFAEGDNGAIMPTGFGQHRECSLRGVLGGIGHHVNHDRYCHGPLGPDAGLTYRQSALMVWETFTGGAAFTEEEIDHLRERLHGTT